jgi:hypothetical protein
MSVVDKYLCPSEIRDFFEPPWNSADCPHCFDDGFHIDSLGHEDRGCSQDIHDIELSLQFGVDMELG